MMAVEEVSQIQRFVGLSTDTKPTNAPPGSKFREADTGKVYVFHDGDWYPETPEVVP